MSLIIRKYYNITVKVVIVFLLLFMVTSAIGQDVNYKAQSLYIYKFTHYIDWNTSAGDSDFVIGVYGNSPIFNELEMMAKIKKAGNGKKIVIRQISNITQLSDEKIIYIASSKSRELRSILQLVENKPVLLVAEREGLARKGASINFIVMENNFLRFEINTETIRKSKLSVSDELLKLGYQVQ